MENHYANLKLSSTDEVLMKCIYEHKSLQEMAAAIRVRSTRSVVKRLQRLAANDYMVYVSNKARSHYLTDKGLQHMKTRGYIT